MEKAHGTRSWANCLVKYKEEFDLAQDDVESEEEDEKMEGAGGAGGSGGYSESDSWGNKSDLEDNEVD